MHLHKCHLFNNLHATYEDLHRRNREKTDRPLLRTPTRCRKKTTQLRPNQLRAILIFLITPTTTWLIAGYAYTTETQKVARILNKNSSSNWMHSIHTVHMGSRNDSYCTNLYTNLCHHISTNGKAPPHSHINLQHPTILPFTLTKGKCSKRQLSKSGGYSTFVDPFDKTKFLFRKRVHCTL